MRYAGHMTTNHPMSQDSLDRLQARANEEGKPIRVYEMAGRRSLWVGEAPGGGGYKLIAEALPERHPTTYVRRPDPSEIWEALRSAGRSDRHTHPANHPCHGCVERAVIAIERLLDKAPKR